MARLRVKGGLGPAPDGTPADLEVKDGELFVLAGGSGGWARSALRRIAGLDETLFGVWLDDRSVEIVAPEDRGIGYVFASGALFPHLTVGDNLAFSLRARGVPRYEVEERVSEAARLTGIDALLRRHPPALTHVDRFRAAVARSLVRRPQVLLLEDPFGLAEATSRPEMREALVALHRQTGLTTVVSLPQPSDALAVAHRLALFAGGAVRQIGTPVQLCSEPANRFVAGALGSPPMNLIPLDVEDGLAVLGGMALAVPDVQQVVLGFFPEDVSFAPCGAPSLTLCGSFDRAEVEGSTAVAAVEVSGHPLRARCQSRQLPREGAPITVSIDLGRLRVFRADAIGAAVPWVFATPTPVEATRRALSPDAAVSAMPSVAAAHLREQSTQRAQTPVAPPIERTLPATTDPDRAPKSAVA